MFRVSAGILVAAFLALGAGGLAAHAQSDLPGRSILKGAAVEYLFPEQVTVTAGKPSDVALHFRVAQGLHINSHAPKDEFLIPTTFSIPDGRGVRLDGVAYPAGKIFTLPFDPSTRLSVYTAEFTIRCADCGRRPAITWWRQSCAIRRATKRLPSAKDDQCAIDVIGK